MSMVRGRVVDLQAVIREIIEGIGRERDFEVVTTFDRTSFRRLSPTN